MAWLVVLVLGAPASAQTMIEVPTSPETIERLTPKRPEPPPPPPPPPPQPPRTTLDDGTTLIRYADGGILVERTLSTGAPHGARLIGNSSGQLFFEGAPRHDRPRLQVSGLDSLLQAAGLTMVLVGSFGGPGWKN